MTLHSDNKAMSYEFLIRAIYNCGRFGVAGANADLYRRLIRTAHHFKNDKNEKNIGEYMLILGEIKGYIKSAIYHLRKMESMSDEQFQQVETVENSLVEPTLEKISSAIDKLEEVTQNLGLKVG